MISASDVSALLDLIAPRCWNCTRPATRYLGSPYTDVTSQEYTCDMHQRSGVRYSDLPGAAVIRRVLRMTAIGVASGQDVTKIPSEENQ